MWRALTTVQEMNSQTLRNFFKLVGNLRVGTELTETAWQLKCRNYYRLYRVNEYDHFLRTNLDPISKSLRWILYQVEIKLPLKFHHWLQAGRPA